MRPVFWNPEEGQAFQGDIVLMKLPEEIVVARYRVLVPPTEARVVLQEGELTGHLHRIANGGGLTFFRDDGLARDLPPADAVEPCASRREEKPRTGRAGLYEDFVALQQMIDSGLLRRGLCSIGFLVVEGGPVVLEHEEHAPILIPAGAYYVGGQQEFDAASVKRVCD